MIQVSTVDNPFDVRQTDAVRWVAPNGSTVRGVLQERFPDFQEFEFPTVCLVNQEAWSRDEWDSPLPDDAIVVFVRMAGDPVTLIVALVVAVVAAVVVANVIQSNAVTPAGVGADRENGEPVYTLTGERNQNRLNAAIECVYGRNRLWPAYASRPYNTYSGNQQFQYSLYCLGHGDFDIHSMFFEDTPLQAFDEVQYQVVRPNGTMTLFHDNVDTSAEVASIELFAPNEEEYSGWSAAYVANEPFTRATRLEVDIELPNGLYTVVEEGDDAGELDYAMAEASFEYAPINDQGVIIGGWSPMIFMQRKTITNVPPKLEANTRPGGQTSVTGLVADETEITLERVPYFTKTLKTVTPQRYTLGLNVPAGRYVVRARRVNQKNKDIQSGNVIRWQTLRAFFPSVGRYGGVTLVAVKARASNNLNSNAAGRFNVIATRRLPRWNRAENKWMPAAATRNPIWAFCDVFRASYGGRLPDSFLNLNELSLMADTLASSSINFDWVFDQRSTLWEVARTIARVCRGIPMLDMSQITIIRDTIKNFPTALFNQHNILEGSFSWGLKFRNIEDYDSVEVQYVDPDTWQQETVLCMIDDDLGDHPYSLKLTGCANRRQAFQEGLYLRATQRYVKEQIEFKTGLEGFVPRYGDMILVSHDVPSWGTGGFIVDIDGNNVYLSEDVEFIPGEDHRIIFRKRDGSAAGPYVVTKGVGLRHVILTLGLSEPLEWNPTYEEAPLYLFGKAAYESKRCSVVGIQPEGDDIVAVKCIAYDERVYSFHSVPTPPKNSTPRAVTDPARPIVQGLQVSALPNATDFIQISWQPALGARVYVLEGSNDGVNWNRIVTQPSVVYVMKVIPGIMHLRVAGVNTDIGPWISWTGRVGDVIHRPARVANLRITGLAFGSVTLEWNPLTNKDSYEVTIFDSSTGRFLRRVTVNETRFTYTLDMGDADGLVGDTIIVRLKGVNVVGTSEDARTLTVRIPARQTITIEITLDRNDITLDNNTITLD
jgi:hypothetical protein